MGTQNIIRVVYDGQCRLCGWSVRWVLARIPAEQIYFIPAQTQEGKDLIVLAGIDALDPQTVMVVNDGQVLIKSRAVRFLLRRVGGIWKLGACLLGIVPTALLDKLYIALAQRRYILFGKSDVCFIPNSKISDSVKHE